MSALSKQVTTRYQQTDVHESITKQGRNNINIKTMCLHFQERKLSFLNFFIFDVFIHHADGVVNLFIVGLGHECLCLETISMNMIMFIEPITQIRPVNNHGLVPLAHYINIQCQ